MLYADTKRGQAPSAADNTPVGRVLFKAALVTDSRVRLTFVFGVFIMKHHGGATAFTHDRTAAITAYGEGIEAAARCQNK